MTKRKAPEDKQKVAPVEPKDKLGRPTIYSLELGNHLCDELASGRTLRDVCSDEGMPSEATVRNWALRDDEEARPGFFSQYARAREIGYHAMADETLEIADDGSNDWMLRKQGDDDVEVVNHEVVARSRLRVDTRKWLLSKALPKIYGDKIIHSGDDENPIATKDVTDVDLARRAAFLLRGAAPKGEDRVPGHGHKGNGKATLDS